MRHKHLLIILSLFICFLSLRTLFTFKFFRPHDFTHAARLVEMQRSLIAGQFPVRWSDNFGFGYGMPLFNFYAPLPYYIGQLPLSLGASPINSIKFLYIVNALLAFGGMYFLARSFWGRTGGIIAATVFSFSSYRAVDLFVRGALGEAFAFALFPFVLYGIVLLNKHFKLGLLISSLALTAVLLSHNLTGLFALVFLLPFALIVLNPHKYFRLIPLYLIAFLISAFYTLPAFFEKSFTRIDKTITVGYFDYHNHFLCKSQLLTGIWGYGGSVPGCQDGIDFSLGVPTLALAALALIVVILLGKIQDRRHFFLLLFLFFVASFMTLGRSSFLWDHFPLLTYFQFPWRFLTFAHVFLASLTGALALGLKRSRLFLIPLLILLAFLLYTELPHFAPEKLESENNLTSFYDVSPSSIRQEISRTLNDYLPVQIKDNAFPSPSTSLFTLDKENSLTVNGYSATAICKAPCLLRINLFQFPGWQALLDGKLVALNPVSSPLPTYSLPLSAGKHNVLLFLSDTPIRFLGNLLSIVGILLLIGIMFL